MPLEGVEERLGKKTHWVPERKARRTLDTLAWLIPAEEYYTYREATKEGKTYAIPEGGPAQVYQSKSEFPGLLPSTCNLEGGEPEVPIPSIRIRKTERAETREYLGRGKTGPRLD